MKKEFYYCNYWEHIYYANYEMCVSDIICSNDNKMAQIHMIIMKNEKVVRGMSTSDLQEFECDIREIIRNVYCENNEFDSGTVKIWYYNFDDSQINSQDIPLRIAVTFNTHKKELSSEEDNDLRNDLYDSLKKIVKCFL